MMMKIQVNGREVPFFNALLHLCCNLQYKFEVREYNEYSLEIATNAPGNARTDSYGCYNTKPMLRLLQIVHTVRGFGMDNVQMPIIFMGDQGAARWIRLHEFKGEHKVKMALAYLGGMEFFFQNDCLPVTEADLEKVCKAYVLHEEDRRTPMKDWLQELTRNVHA